MYHYYTSIQTLWSLFNHQNVDHWRNLIKGFIWCCKIYETATELHPTSTLIVISSLKWMSSDTASQIRLANWEAYRLIFLECMSQCIIEVYKITPFHARGVMTLSGAVLTEQLYFKNRKQERFCLHAFMSFTHGNELTLSKLISLKLIWIPQHRWLWRKLYTSRCRE